MNRLEEIDLELVDAPEKDIREDMGRTGIDELVISIQNVGLIQPITVFENNGRYEIITGHRRYVACKMAKLDTLPAIVTESRPEEIDVMRLDENIFREDLSPVEIAKYIYKIKTEKGIKTAEVARYFGKTPQWVNMMLRILDLDDYTKEAIGAGAISYQGALELQKVDSEEARQALTQAAVRGGAHTRTIKNWVREHRGIEGTAQRMKESGQPAEEEEEREPYRQRCIICEEQKETETLITVETCHICYPILKEMAKSFREG